MNSFKVLALFAIIFNIQFTQILGRCPPSKSCRDPNEEYAVDPKRSQNTCEYYGCYNQIQCPGSSKTGDCYCKKGYARRFPNGPCISIKHRLCARLLKPTREDCEKRENEVYMELLGYRPCENTCENVGVDCVTLNSPVATWSPWCDCVENYARLHGTCVSINDPKCRALNEVSVAGCARRGEVFRVGRMCESIPNCAEPNGQKYVCLAEGEAKRCYCKQGQLRNKLGKCVPKEECHLYQ